MSTNDRIIEQFNRLLEEGKKILKNSGFDGKHYKNGSPSDIDYQRFRSQSLNIIRRACGEDRDHYIELTGC